MNILSNEFTNYLSEMARVCSTWADATTAPRKRARWVRRSNAYRCAAGLMCSERARRRILQWLSDETAEYRDVLVAV